MANINFSRKSGFIRRGGVMRRETLWISQAILNTSLAGSGTAINLAAMSAAVLELTPFTIVRTRGLLYMRSDQLAAAETVQAAYGHTVVADTAAAIGVTAIPTPVTDAGNDLWFVYQYMFGHLQFGDGTGFGDPGRVYEFDSRGMRKVEDGQTSVVTLETSANSQGVVVQSAFR